MGEGDKVQCFQTLVTQFFVFLVQNVPPSGEVRANCYLFSKFNHALLWATDSTFSLLLQLVWAIPFDFERVFGYIFV